MSTWGSALAPEDDNCAKGWMLISSLHRVESSSSSAVVERLTRIEAILEDQSQRLDDIARGSYGTGTSGTSSSLHTRRPVPRPLNASPHLSLAGASPASASSQSEGNLDADVEQTQFLIPYDHSTSANSLLSWPRVKALVGDYPKDYFYTIEESLPLPNSLDPFHDEADHWPAMSPNILDSLAHNYFATAHPNYPLFTSQTFQDWHTRLYEHGPQGTPETAICLCVYALGCLVSPGENRTDEEVQSKKDQLGLQFFQPALRIILRHTTWGFRPSMEICQALLLCASYFAHVGRPLHSWKMVYYASENFISLHYK